jgi:hypothetical protein
MRNEINRYAAEDTIAYTRFNPILALKIPAAPLIAVIE